VVVYVEDRQPGDNVALSITGQIRDGMKAENERVALRSWQESNLARLDAKPNDWASMEEKEEGNVDDGEGQED